MIREIDVGFARRRFFVIRHLKDLAGIREGMTGGSAARFRKNGPLLGCRSRQASARRWRARIP